ncbi:hypothetical protein [Caballeronia hypogeia]|uniref:hypothetical protein n=1 Tax=Caballeronia hypogeia TaxID=1777140 RepID=UPI0012FD4448|nr:hypothetical protein [Caballeronia hypogeia]
MTRLHVDAVESPSLKNEWKRRLIFVLRRIGAAAYSARKPQASLKSPPDKAEPICSPKRQSESGSLKQSALSHSPSEYLIPGRNFRVNDSAIKACFPLTASGGAIYSAVRTGLKKRLNRKQQDKSGRFNQAIVRSFKVKSANRDASSGRSRWKIEETLLFLPTVQTLAITSLVRAKLLRLKE